MSTFCNEKRLLLDMMEAINSLEECKTDDERRALYDFLSSCKDILSYIRNDYDFLKKLNIDKTEYDKYMKINADEYNDMILTVLDNEEFFKKLFYSINRFSNINGNLILNNYENKDYKLDKDTFYSLFEEFCKKIDKEKCFEEFRNKKSIIKVESGDNVDFVGQLIYNPVDNNKRIVMRNFNYSLRCLLTLIHEFGHYIDFDDLINNNSCIDINNYLYKTYNLEIISKLYEKLFIKFMLDKGYLEEEVKDIGLYLKYSGLHYIYNVTNLLREYDKNKKDRRNIMINSSDLIEINDLGIVPNIVYGIGEYCSTILMDDIEKKGLDSKLYKDYYENRFKYNGLNYLDNNDFNIARFNKIQVKQLEYLKK